MKTLLCLFTVVLAVCFSEAANPEHLAKINKFFEVTQMQQQYEMNLTARFSAFPGAANLEGMPEEDRAKYEQMMQRVKDIVVAEAGWSKVKDDMAELYAKHYSEEEIDKILKLIDNDTGKMLYRKQIELLPDSVAYAQKRMQELAPKIAAILSEPAKERAKSIKCANNLKQIGLAFRTWAIDQRATFPFNLSTNEGGTLEYCSRGSDGADINAYIHFQVMSNALSTPKILVCPGDSAKQPAFDFQHLQATNVSYILFSGTNVDEDYPQEILARCPIHGNVLLCDGSVQKRK
jgi:hypothetical protein